MSLLSRIKSPADLRSLNQAQLTRLAREIRKLLIESVSKTGGHLGPNLGVVELTLAIHRVFDSPRDPIIFDTGHQSYVHKIITGRAADFNTLRQEGGLSGYPSRTESEHDWVENSHASTSLSWAEGMAKGFRLRGEKGRTVVAVIGDGALTGGMAWEALNNIAVEPDLQLVIIVNDNGRSYSETVGGLSQQLAGIRTNPHYKEAANWFNRNVSRVPLVGRHTAEFFAAMRSAARGLLVPQVMFSDLGIKYIGPFDGHDITAMERAFRQAKLYGGPVIVHAITRKGEGFLAAERDGERFHTVGAFNEVTGEPKSASLQATWTDAFAQELVELGEAHPEVVALTAAMLQPTGLSRFAAAYPARVFDVGIAEQHAVASAAGLATAGLHPIFVVYSTFLNRAFDQLLMDVALHQVGVTFVLDRSGITGPDGATHHGVWDVSLAALVPGLRLATPRDRLRLHQTLQEAIAVNDAPTMVRYSKNRVPDEIETVSHLGSLDVTWCSEDAPVLLVGYGEMAATALVVAKALQRQGIGALVVDPVWALPISADLVAATRGRKLVVTIEDNLVVGGLGSALELAMDAAGIEVPTRQFGVPREFIAPGTRDQVLKRLGLTPKAIAASIIETYVALKVPTPEDSGDTATSGGQQWHDEAALPLADS
ncbi:MAG: 1-deoxy-D-xylulose-5-phosphate synthase [Propionibacteriaceae bacterium]|jgi:1-deoxy-D-xylulose-5-phosphate synthase|nr:1-deoxy-D-xylulose-5-phosphate synthase [Propionibacteriaceae bacterium]